MIIAKNDCLKIEIHETKYGGYKTLRLQSVSGSDREIYLVRLKIGDDESILQSFHGTITIRNDFAFRYYENMKSSFLKTFGLMKEGSE